MKKIDNNRESINYFKNRWDNPDENLLNYLKRHRNETISISVIQGSGFIETASWIELNRANITEKINLSDDSNYQQLNDFKEKFEYSDDERRYEEHLKLQKCNKK